MDDLEGKSELFRGGSREEVSRGNFVTLTSDHFDNYLLKIREAESALTAEIESNAIYDDDATFWVDATANKLFEGQVITLKNAAITEWLPASPGRFHTPEAAQSREKAEFFYMPEPHASHYPDGYYPHFTPPGKTAMVLGGVGSVRLAAHESPTGLTHFLGAAMTGICHRGVPIALAADMYGKVIQQIKERGGCRADIVGTLRIMKESFHQVRHDRKTPKYYLRVNDVSPVRPCDANELVATAAIMFSSPEIYFGGKQSTVAVDGQSIAPRKTWSFASFDPHAGPAGLQQAVDWLKTYVNGHTAYEYNLDSLPIFADFDEHFNHFGEPAEFPLRDVASGGFQWKRLGAYVNYYDIKIKELVMGDKFDNIKNATIINRSLVQNAFNKTAERQDEETANALVEIAEAVEQSQNAAAAVLLDKFMTEVSNDKPDKSSLRQCWDGLVAVLPAVANLTLASAKIAELFS